MYTSDKVTKLVYLIYDNYNCGVVVSYRTHAYNSRKGIFSTLSSATKVLNKLNADSPNRYEIIQYRR